ncbi:hypothetical protein [Tenacibaculum amylolyticum]|uniref:hypothetical protein n=1 Tax=Tenacibaculum amylolyticum TaxID=104269 RepID=UPI003895439E
MKLESLEKFEELNQEHLNTVKGGFYETISELGDPDRPSRKVDYIGKPKYASL